MQGLHRQLYAWGAQSHLPQRLFKDVTGVTGTTGITGITGMKVAAA
jgi:hypothetical protein